MPSITISIYKQFDTDMCFRGSEYRERLLLEDFLVCYYFLKERQQMEDSLCLSNLEHLSLVTQSSRWSFVILMYTLINPGRNFLYLKHCCCVLKYLIELDSALLLFCSGEILLWRSSCLECSPSFTISWRYAVANVVPAAPVTLADQLLILFAYYGNLV